MIDVVVDLFKFKLLKLLFLVGLLFVFVGGGVGFVFMS